MRGVILNLEGLAWEAWSDSGVGCGYDKCGPDLIWKLGLSISEAILVRERNQGGSSLRSQPSNEFLFGACG